MAELFFLFKVYIESNIWYEKAVDLHRRRMLKEDIVNYLINKKVIIKAEAKEEGKWFDIHKSNSIELATNISYENTFI